MIKLAALALPLLGVMPMCGGGPAPAPASSMAVVKSVYDGDTIRLTNGESVRLIGVDTPEVANPGWGVAEECGATQARDRLRQLVPAGTRVNLVVSPGRADRDDTPSHRLLRYVETATADVGRVLLAEGLAHTRYDDAPTGPTATHVRRDDYRTVDAQTPNVCG